jgi:hypothetical protein
MLALLDCRQGRALEDLYGESDSFTKVMELMLPHLNGVLSNLWYHARASAEHRRAEGKGVDAKHPPLEKSPKTESGTSVG